MLNHQPKDNMLLNVPAVASTTGTATSVTWRSDGIYAYTGKLRIAGRFLAGTFSNGETVTQSSTGATAVVSGAQSSGLFLLVTTGNGVPNGSSEWRGNSSSATFEPIEKWKFPPNLLIYIALPGKAGFTVPADSSHIVLQEAAATATQLKMVNNYRYGTTLKYLDCALPTFTVPSWAKSFSIQNAHASNEIFYRAYRPNISAQLIDTTAASLSDTSIVGFRLIAGQSVGFSDGEFTPGSSYMLVASSALTGGALVEFQQ